MTSEQARPLLIRLIIWATAAIGIFFPLFLLARSGALTLDPDDVMGAGVMLVFVGLVAEVALRLPARHAWRAGAALALATGLLLAWGNLAVGVIGSEDNPVNRLFWAVHLVALVGAAISRLKPKGLCRAMAATAATQLLIGVGAFAAGLGFTGPLTVSFTSLWLSSAWLFRRASH